MSIINCIGSLILSLGLGGVSGDLLGYAQQIAELATAFGLFFVLVK